MKKVFTSLLAFVLVLYTTACSMSGSTTQKYLNALNNTQTTDSLESKTEAKITIDLSKASDGEKRKLDTFKEIKLNIDTRADNKNNRMEINSYINFDKYFWGVKTYINGEQIFIKVNDKFVKLNDIENDDFSLGDNKLKEEYEEFLKEFQTIWKEAVQNEILAAEGNTIESTPDGDIKVTQLSLELNDEKSKNVLDSIAVLLSKSEAIKKLIVESVKRFENTEGIDKEDMKELTENMGKLFNELPENMKDYKEKFRIDKLKLTAKIDKDLYIIDEVLEGEIVLKLEGEVRINITTRTTRWNLNKRVNIDIPQITEEDLVDAENFYNEIKENFEDIFRN